MYLLISKELVMDLIDYGKLMSENNLVGINLTCTMSLFVAYIYINGVLLYCIFVENRYFLYS